MPELASPGQTGLAVFDFDGTLTRGDTLLPYLRRSLGWWRYVRVLCLSAPWLLAYALRLMRNHTAKARLLQVSLGGRSVQEVQRWSEDFVAHYLPQQWRSEARAQLAACQQSGRRCLIVSASTGLYMHRVGQLLGVDTVLCTEMEVQDGRYTGRMRTPNCYGQEKVRRLQGWMAAEGLVPARTPMQAYGDSAGDLALLRMADQAWYQGQPWQERQATALTPSAKALLALLFALHFVIGALVGLTADEAHYALYAVHLALSYFDHPPLVGWIQWPLVALNAPDAILRLIPGLLWLGMAVQVYLLAERLRGSVVAPSRAGLWAVLALALAPLPHVLGIGLLPDTLLMFLTPTLMGLTLNLLEAPALQRPLPWLVLGLCLGLAGLSKYTAIFAALAVAACLVAGRGGRVLLQRGPWLAVAVALLVVQPVLVWNAQNQWVSLVYQARHGAGGAWTVLHLAQFLLVQLFAFGPLLLWGPRGVRLAPTPGHRYLAWFFVIPFLVLAYMAGGGSSLPHWTTPAWVALAPFAGLALAHSWHKGRRTLLLALAVLQGLASTALLVLMVTAGVPWVRGTSNPFADLHGWDAAAQRAVALAQQHKLSSVAVQNWTLASRLGWYARPLPVHVLDSGFSQFDLWDGSLPAGADTLLVEWSNMAFELPLGAHGFTDCRLLEQHSVQRLGQEIADFHFYACHGWSAQPQPLRKGPT